MRRLTFDLHLQEKTSPTAQGAAQAKIALLQGDQQRMGDLALDIETSFYSNVHYLRRF
jgi:hypothetical protein